MSTVCVDLPHHRYEVRIGAGDLAQIGERIRAVAPHRRAAVFADQTVFAMYGESVVASLRSAGYDVIAVPFHAGEENKHLTTMSSLYEHLLDAKLERKSPVIALGGGVTGDMVGFVAATYLRGVPFVQIPTTLLAMVDSSVGGKVGVNVPQGKNLIGAFHQPVLVVIDPRTLATLPVRELRCGLAECVKHGLLADSDLFDWMDANVERLLTLDERALSELVERNVRIKAAIVMQDEKEEGIRSLLNLGHTFGHAIEATSGYGVLLHGEAVGLGLIAATELSTRLGRCEANAVGRTRRLLERIGLPVAAALVDTDALMAAMTLDKKVADGKVRLVLLDRIGAATLVTDVPSADVRAAWETIRAA